MCWRDDEVMTRRCSFCGEEYYGDLGHRNCPKFKKPDDTGTTSEPTSNQPDASD